MKKHHKNKRKEKLEKRLKKNEEACGRAVGQLGWVEQKKTKKLNRKIG